MKIIVKLEDVNARETVKNDRKSLMVRVKGRDKNGVVKASYLFDDSGRAFEAKIAELIPSGVDYNNSGILVEFNGFEKKSTQNDGTFFSVSSFSVLSGAELELQKIKFSAAELERKLKSLSHDDITGRYSAMSEYIASTGIEISNTPVVSPEIVETQTEVPVEEPEVVVEAIVEHFNETPVTDTEEEPVIEKPTVAEEEPLQETILETEIVISKEPEEIITETVIEPAVVTQAPIEEEKATVVETPALVEEVPTIAEEIIPETNIVTVTDEKAIETITEPGEQGTQDLPASKDTAEAVVVVAHKSQGGTFEDAITTSTIPVTGTVVRSQFRTVRALEETEGEVTSTTLSSNPEEDAKLQLGNPPPPPKPKSLFTKSSPFGRGIGGGLSKPLTETVAPEATPTPAPTPTPNPTASNEGPVRGYKPAGFAMGRR